MTSRSSDVIPAQAGIPFLDVAQDRLEFLDVPARRTGLPELLLLHEGLGSVSMWRDFPQALAAATGCRTIAYSRRGFGRSSPPRAPYTPRFMHEEALATIPELRERPPSPRPGPVPHSTGAPLAPVHAAPRRRALRG